MAIVRDICITGLALFLLGTAIMDLHAQTSPYDPEMSAQAGLIQERVDLYSDRSLYIAGEAVRFMARVQTYGLPEGSQWSRILYLELLSASGERRAQGKYQIQKGTAFGEIRIPEGLLTGTFFLRSYTRWMRNRYPDSYSYMPLRIINPYTPELAEAGPDEEGEIKLVPLSMTKGELAFLKQSYSSSRGDTIRLDLSHSGADGSGMVKGCLSVVPAATQSGAPMQVSDFQEGEAGVFQLSFLPDMYGVTLSGRVVHTDEEDQGLADTRIHFSLLAEKSTYFMARSDAYGNFALTLPKREGKLELLVQPEYTGEAAVEVRIEQDFDSRILPLKVPDFNLSLEERQILIQMARKLQLSGIYMEGLPLTGFAEALDSVPFYGSPGFTLTMDEYVLLPTMEEVFINLVPGVTPLTRRNKTDLMIASDNPAMSMFPPLIMIDQVPLFSMEQFLSVSPGKISHIDVVNDVYLKGDQRFGGIINLRSRERNMAGIDLPDHSFFFDFEALYPQRDSPADRTLSKDKMPDTRNTLLWMPEMQIDGSGPLSLSFVAPDYPGEYVVLFRGWDEKGNSISAESRITVE